MLATRLNKLKTTLTAQQVRLVAVTKGVSVEKMRLAYEHGTTCFAESYWQEAQLKLPLLSDCAIEWHFIGRLQSNKCALIARHFDWVQSVSTLHHAIALNKGRVGQAPLNICLQVNVDAEPQKSGLAMHALPDIIGQLTALSHLRLRGLMLLPKEDSLASFQMLAQLFQQVKKALALPISFDTLSMGMSVDYQEAIDAGSTMVRIGSWLFK